MYPGYEIGNTHMSRSDRLIRLMQALRRLPSPVTANRLAFEMEISERSIYRDIQSLRASGAIIDGEAGYGYTLNEDPFLPPMQFDGEEVEALAFGLKSVIEIGDDKLRFAAENAFAKLEACLPNAMRSRLRHSVTGVRSRGKKLVSGIAVSHLRDAIWEEQVATIDYLDLKERKSQRKIWPLTIYYFDSAQVVIAWCCLREDFRMFRLDRIQSINFLDEYFRPKRVGLLREHFEQQEANGYHARSEKQE